MSLDLLDRVSFLESSLEVWISSQVAFSVVVVNVSLEQEIVSHMHNFLTLMSVVQTCLLAVIFVQTWA